MLTDVEISRYGVKLYCKRQIMKQPQGGMRKGPANVVTSALAVTMAVVSFSC